jgi:hypothetical protein
MLPRNIIRGLFFLRWLRGAEPQLQVNSIRCFAESLPHDQRARERDQGVYYSAARTGELLEGLIRLHHVRQRTVFAGVAKAQLPCVELSDLYVFSFFFAFAFAVLTFAEAAAAFLARALRWAFVMRLAAFFPPAAPDFLKYSSSSVIDPNLSTPPA